MIIFDSEIKALIPPKNGGVDKKYTYCGGWSDYIGMGISVVVVYDYADGLIKVYMDDNFSELKQLIDNVGVVVGFNNDKFDNILLDNVWGIKIPEYKSYDIFKEMLMSKGVDDFSNYKNYSGYGLEKVAQVNGAVISKAGSGKDAPKYYQDNQYGKLITYCISDVMLTKVLLDSVFCNGGLIDPKTKQLINMRLPK